MMQVLKELVQGKPVQDPIYTGPDVCTKTNQDACLSGRATRFLHSPTRPPGVPVPVSKRWMSRANLTSESSSGS